MPLALLIPLLSPLVTEGFKLLMGLIQKDVPPALVPITTVAAGTLINAAGQAVGVDFGVDGQTAAGLGLAGVGVHQFVRMAGQAAPSAPPSGPQA